MNNLIRTGTYFDSLRLKASIGLLMIASIVGLSHVAMAATLAWDQSPDPSVVGYNLYSGQVGGSSTNKTDVGDELTYPVPGLSAGVTYFFYVTAYNAAAVESVPSNLITYTVPGNNSPPTISLIADQTVGAGGTLGPITFTVGDAETPASSLVLSRGSSNPTLVSTNAIVFGGSGANRTVTVGPVGAQAGTAIVTVTVSDGTSATSTNFVLTVQAAPLGISTVSLANGTVNVGYAATLSATGGTAPYNWSLASGILPGGLTLDPGTGGIVGTPTTVGTYNFTAQVSDASSPASTATKALSIVVAALPQTVGNTTDGSSTDILWSGGAWINAVRFQAASTLTATEMRAKVTAIAGSYKCAIYTDNGGQPAALLGSTAEVSNPTSGWQTFALPSALVLAGGQSYWLAVWSDDADAEVYYSDSNGTLQWGRYDYGSWPNPLNTSGSGSLNYCIYATQSTPLLDSIAITPANPSIVAGGTQQFVATGTYSDGSTANLTSSATWTSSATAVATVSSGGLATAVSPGNTTITAAVGSVSGNTSLTVQTAPLAIVTTALPDGTAGVAYTATLAASGGKTPYSWSVTVGALPGGLTLNPATGVISGTPTTAGTANFTVQVSDASAPAQSITKALSVTVASSVPTLSSIAVTPANPSIAAGGTQQFAATGTYSDGSTQDLTSQATWSSSNPSVATVSSSGLASGVAAGNTTITASVNNGQLSVNDAVPLTVSSGTTAGLVYLPIEAEAAQLLAPMAVSSDTNASMGQFIASPTADLGTATFTVNVPDSGDYVVWCRILSPNASTDSLYVNSDGGGEAVYQTAPNGWANVWQWSVVTDASVSGTNPRIFQLGSGQHVIGFRGREAGTALDQILVTNDRDFIPDVDSTSFAPNHSALPPTLNPAGSVTLTWPTIPGRTYRVQYKTNLSDPLWTILKPDITATGSSTSLEEVPVGDRFFGISLLP